MAQARLAEKPSLALTRSYPVAPAKVWRAWTDPQALKRWWGPGGPEGKDHEVQGVYKEVVPNRKLVFTWTWPNSTPERESLVTVEFKAVGRGTELDFLHEQHFDETVRDNHKRGWSESFAKLDHYLQQN